ncbi:MAG: ComF family protein [Bacteroidetes bacterium]|nr:ComF family protein [Bacteroidota bacterium]
MKNPNKLLKHFHSITNYFLDSFQLIFPNNCLACGNSLRYSERFLCTSCLIDIPRVHLHNSEHSALEQMLVGQIPYEQAAAFFYYTKKNKYANLLHVLKYKGNKNVGIFLGELFARQLQATDFMTGIDCIVPIPLHAKRERTRGYNQSKILAQGIANITSLPLCATAVERSVNTETQTKKNKEERKQNVANIFTVTNPHLLQNKHILLLDDVITTGATTISCADAILNQVPNVRISIAGLALAQN